MKQILVSVPLALAAMLAGCEQSHTSVNTGQAIVPRGQTFGENVAAKAWPPIPPDSRATATDRLAKNYYVVLDASGSMRDAECTARDSKFSEALVALQTFARKLSSDAQLGIVAFDNNGTSERLPLGPYNEARMIAALSQLHPGAGTPLADAMMIGYEALTRQATSQLGTGEYHLVVVTDGAANSGQDVVGAVRTIVTRSPVVIHAIGFCLSNNHALNQAGITRYIAASDGAALSAGLASVLAEAPTFDAAKFESVQ